MKNAGVRLTFFENTLVWVDPFQLILEGCFCHEDSNSYILKVTIFIYIYIYICIKGLMRVRV